MAAKCMSSRVVAVAPRIHKPETGPLALPVRGNIGFDACPTKSCQSVAHTLVAITVSATICRHKEIVGSHTNHSPYILTPAVKRLNQMADAVDPQVFVVDCCAAVNHRRAVALVHAHPLVTRLEGKQGVLYACNVILRNGIKNVRNEEIKLSVPMGR